MLESPGTWGLVAEDQPFPPEPRLVRELHLGAVTDPLTRWDWIWRETGSGRGELWAMCMGVRP